MTVLSSPSWTLADDSGNGQTGTVLDAAWAAALKADINLLLHSTANPTLSPAQITDEVVQARGSKASLDARLDVSLNNDGTLITGSTPTFYSIGNGIGATNLVLNDDFLLWSAGDAAAPDGWSLSAGTIARAGVGLGDTTHLIGDFCVKHTSVNALVQTIIAVGTEWARFSTLIGTAIWSNVSPYVTAGVWVKTGFPGTFLGINDGAGTTFSTEHPGDGNWRFLSCRRLLTAASTSLSLFIGASGNAAYFSGATCMFGENQLYAWQPSPKTRRVIVFNTDGNAAVLTDKFRFLNPRPFRVEDCRLGVRAAPTVTPLIVDLMHCTANTPTYASMYATRPQIAAAAFYGSATPDAATYRNRCFAGYSSGGSSAIDRALSVDIAQVGGGVTGSELCVIIAILEYQRAIESMLNS